ncbi:MAG: RNA polymerase sigma factor [Planctomycetota bacterium]
MDGESTQPRRSAASSAGPQDGSLPNRADQGTPSSGPAPASAAAVGASGGAGGGGGGPGTDRGGSPDATSQLIRKAVAGDRAALEELADWLHPLMATWAHWQLRNATHFASSAEDLVQDVWLQMLPKLTSLRAHPRSRRMTPALLAVMRRALRNRVIDVRRAAARRAMGTLHDGDDNAELAASNTGPLTQAVRTERRLVIERALARLSVRDRVLYTKRIFEGTSLQELADEFQLSIDGVLKARQRARRLLAKTGGSELLALLEPE